MFENNQFILSQEENRIYSVAICHAIEKARYIESEKEGRDLQFNKNGNPSEDQPINWIKNNAAYYREAWPKSCCRTCKNVTNCYDCLKEHCDNYIKNV